MKLSEWVKRERMHYQIAWRWFQRGVLPINAVQLETGTILVEDESEVQAGGVALYGRVSSSDQKVDLERQLARRVEFATKRKLSMTQAVTEVGAGLNGTRTKLLRPSEASAQRY